MPSSTWSRADSFAKGSGAHGIGYANHAKYKCHICRRWCFGPRASKSCPPETGRPCRKILNQRTRERIRKRIKERRKRR